MDDSGFEAANNTAVLAMRSLLLINGGAVVALLAFVGALQTGASGSTVEISSLVDPIWWFAVGVGLAAATAVLAYLVNVADADVSTDRTFTFEHPYSRDAPGIGWISYARHVLYVGALTSGLGSLTAFFFGVDGVTDAIGRLGI